MSYSNVEHTTIKFRVHIVSVSNRYLRVLGTPMTRTRGQLRYWTSIGLPIFLLLEMMHFSRKPMCWVCRLSLLAAQALLPSHQVGTQTATGIDFPRVLEWPNAWLLMTFDGKWTCQARIYYNMLWRSSLRTSASRFWRQVMSAGAVLLTIWVIFQIWNHDIFTSRYRLANEFTTVKLYLKVFVDGRSSD